MRKIKCEGFSPNSAPGFERAWRFIVNEKIRKKSEKFLGEDEFNHGVRHGFPQILKINTD